MKMHMQSRDHSLWYWAEIRVISPGLSNINQLICFCDSIWWRERGVCCQVKKQQSCNLDINRLHDIYLISLLFWNQPYSFHLWNPKWNPFLAWFDLNIWAFPTFPSWGFRLNVYKVGSRGSRKLGVTAAGTKGDSAAAWSPASCSSSSRSFPNPSPSPPWTLFCSGNVPPAQQEKEAKSTRCPSPS